MFSISVSQYGFDYTDHVRFEGKGNLAYAQTVWDRYGDKTPFKRDGENSHSWEARGGFSFVTIRPV
jgi:hypothetical protein